MNRIPYTYFIKQKDTGFFYYGVKYGKDANPKTFWKENGYFTSSKVVKMLIKKYGNKSFDVQVRRIFECPNKAKKWEDGVIRRIRNWDKCLNTSLGGDAIKSHKNRHIEDENGLNSYQRAGKKLSETLKKNPELVKMKIEKMIKTINAIDENGLTIIQKRAEKMKGILNPSTKSENKEKISQGVLNWNNKNPKQVQQNKDKAKQAMIDKGTHKKHSKWMLENNPTTGTIWVNNGKRNFRVLENEIPEDCTIGKLVFKKYERTEMTCPHCNKTGKGPNMTRYHFDNCKLIKL